MDAAAEGQVAVRCAMHIQLVRVLEHFGVTVRRADAEMNVGACADLDAADLYTPPASPARFTITAVASTATNRWSGFGRQAAPKEKLTARTDAVDLAMFQALKQQQEFRMSGHEVRRDSGLSSLDHAFGDQAFQDELERVSPKLGGVFA